MAGTLETTVVSVEVIPLTVAELLPVFVRFTKIPPPL